MLMSVIVDGGLYREEDFMLRGLFPDALVAQRDRFVLTVINKRQVAPSDFITQGENGYILRDEPRKELLAAWQQRKREEIMHPFLQERIPIGLLPYAQALLLARCLRGDLDDYPVFLIQN